MAGQGGTGPTVVVGVPVRNGADYLGHALASLVGQTRPPDTIVVSDNASDDDSVAIARSFASEHPDLRVVSRPHDVGAALNYNELVTTTRSTYFAWMAHDDVWDPDLLERCLEVLEDDPRVAVAHATPVWIDERGEVIGAPVSPLWTDSDDPVVRIRELLADDVATHLHDCNAVLGVIRRAALERTGLVRTFPGSDKTLIVELALQGMIRELDTTRFLRRRHAASSVAAHPDPDDRQRWFDPRRRRPASPVTDLVATYLAAIASARHLSRRSRVVMAATVLRWSLSGRRPRIIAGELRRRVSRRRG